MNRRQRKHKRIVRYQKRLKAVKKIIFAMTPENRGIRSIQIGRFDESKKAINSLA